jgi:hypothetical protein
MRVSLQEEEKLSSAPLDNRLEFDDAINLIAER